MDESDLALRRTRRENALGQLRGRPVSLSGVESQLSAVGLSAKVPYSSACSPTSVGCPLLIHLEDASFSAALCGCQASSRDGSTVSAGAMVYVLGRLFSFE